MTFRRVDTLYRRSHEVHRLRLYQRREILDALRAAGFRVQAQAGYDKLPLPTGWVVFAARKPIG